MRLRERAGSVTQAAHQRLGNHERDAFVRRARVEMYHVDFYVPASKKVGKGRHALHRGLAQRIPS